GNTKANTIHSPHYTRIGIKMRVKVLHIKNGLIGIEWRSRNPPLSEHVIDFHRCLDLGSSQSRTPSPIKLKPMTTVRIASPGKADTHHCATSWRPSATMEPHSGVGGTTPNPRKE